MQTARFQLFNLDLLVCTIYCGFFERTLAPTIAISTLCQEHTQIVLQQLGIPFAIRPYDQLMPRDTSSHHALKVNAIALCEVGCGRATNYHLDSLVQTYF